MTPNATVMFQDLSNGEITSTLSVRKPDQLVPVQQSRPHRETRFAVYMMLPAFAVEHRFDMHVPGFIAVEIVAHQATRILFVASPSDRSRRMQHDAFKVALGENPDRLSLRD